MKNVCAFIKREAVLCIALMLGVISAFIIPPDREYAGYIDFRTLAILFCLMAVMAGLQSLGVFQAVALGFLQKVRGVRGLVLVLLMLSFCSSMLITNDVALITFVPFTITVLGMMGEETKKRLILPLVALETVAANLGSMLTPVGNPQNLYLYGKAGMSVGGFLALMLPYTLFSLALLLVWGLVMGKRCALAWPGGKGGIGHGEKPSGGKKRMVSMSVYLALFLLCLLSVAHVLPWQAVLAVVVAAVLLTDRKVFKKVDYSLLLTFVGFFVFIGNAGRIPAFGSFLAEATAGREVYVAVAASQIISNVPAALLLSGFTTDYSRLIIGVNLGGLGTLIASMASLISWKCVTSEETERKGEYLAVFTAGNVCFLAALLLFHLLLGIIQA